MAFTFGYPSSSTEQINATFCFLINSVILLLSSQDLKTVAQAWIDAIGTAGEKAAADALLAELKEDVCTIDQVIPFFESPRAVQYFGEAKAKEFAALAHKIKADGGKWCFCEACAAGAKLLENAEAFSL